MAMKARLKMGLPNVKTEISSYALPYNLKRMIKILGVKALISAADSNLIFENYFHDAQKFNFLQEIY